MNVLKKNLGILWMIIGPIAIAFLIFSAFVNINGVGKGDINKPLPWIIIISIFTPIAIGLTIFGWYCWKGEYSAHLNPRLNDIVGQAPEGRTSQPHKS